MYSHETRHYFLIFREREVRQVFKEADQFLSLSFSVSLSHTQLCDLQGLNHDGWDLVEERVS